MSPNRKARVSARLSPDLRARIELLAAQDEMTLSRWLEGAIREVVERRHYDAERRRPFKDGTAASAA